MKPAITLFCCCMLCYNLIAQPMAVPAGYALLQEVSGDLDKDGIPEKAVVYNTADTSEETGGIIRELILYKKVGTAWKTWQQSRNAVFDSKSGGMMGDPFEEINIKNGILLITQAGGSSWKWGHTDKYRFQFNRFELIGYTSNYGKPCEYWTDVDYNISTGLVIVKKAFEQCNDQGDGQKVYKREDESFTHKLREPIHIGNRNQANVKIVSPKYRHEIYL